MLTQVDQDNFDLAAIIGVNRARRIHQREPFVECSATSGPYLTLKPGRYFNCNSSRDGGTGERLEHQRFVERRKQINPCSVLAVITRYGSAQALNFDDRNNQQIKWTLLLARVITGCDEKNRLSLQATRRFSCNREPNAHTVSSNRATAALPSYVH